MNYALVEDGVVVNLMSIHEDNAAEYPNAVPVNDVPVYISDSYSDGHFYRNSERVLSPLEQAEEIIAGLDAEVVDLTYQNILLELGVE